MSFSVMSVRNHLKVSLPYTGETWNFAVNEKVTTDTVILSLLDKLWQCEEDSKIDIHATVKHNKFYWSCQSMPHVSMVLIILGI